jgi:hypothetical protein
MMVDVMMLLARYADDCQQSGMRTLFAALLVTSGHHNAVALVELRRLAHLAVLLSWLPNSLVRDSARILRKMIGFVVVDCTHSATISILGIDDG